MNENLPAPVKIPLSEAEIVSLAGDLVHNFEELDDVLAKYRLTPEQYDTLRLNPFFIKILEAEAAAWGATSNAQERARVKAGLLVENLLPALNARLHDKKEDLEQVIKGAQTLIKIAGIGERVNLTQESTPQDKFVIQINMGGNQEVTYSKDKTPTPPLPTAKIIEGKPNDQVQSRVGPSPSLFIDPTPSGNFFLGGD
jgi:hypothetical protein